MHNNKNKKIKVLLNIKPFKNYMRYIKQNLRFLLTEIAKEKVVHLLNFFLGKEGML